MIKSNIDKSELTLAKETVDKIRKTMPKAYYAAAQRTGQQVKTLSVRLVREKYHIKAKDVNQRVTLRRGSARNPSVELHAKGRNIPIIKFRANPNKPAPKIGELAEGQRRRKVRPVRAAVKRSGLKEIKDAFITKVGRGGHVGIFKRAGRRRLPIEEVHGPAVPVMMGTEDVIDKMTDFAEEKFKERLDHEIERRLGNVGEKIT